MKLCDVSKCTGCMCCYKSCEYGAISIYKDELGFSYPKIDNDKCKNCGNCAKKCPILLNYESNPINKSYACSSKNLDLRLSSSSGGIFSLLAEIILSVGGVVYGAGYNESFEVKHLRIVSINDLNKIKGSKYVQSNIIDSYEKLRNDLELKIPTLFCGTPCQIASVCSYLNYNYENLYLVDFICHGVGSHEVLKRHVKELMFKSNSNKLLNINFRNKVTGWNNFSFSILTENGPVINNIKEDNFMKSFLKNLCLRTSCYDCKFKGSKRLSDITLGDFWGINKISDKFTDDKGTSAVILNSNKGVDLFSKIIDNIDYIPVNYQDIKDNNICLENQSRYNKYRDDYIKDFADGFDLSNMNEKYFKGE